MAIFRLLHLSDVHFGCTDTAREHGRITDALIEAVDDFVHSSRQPDVLIFSGDLANAANETEFNAGGLWLHKLAANLSCPIFIVPGNHDITHPRDGSDAYHQMYKLRAAAQTGDGFAKVHSELHSQPHMDAFLEWHGRNQSSLGLISDWSSSKFGCSHKLNHRDIPVHIVGLNTAMVSLDDGDQGLLVADVAMLNTLLRRIDFEHELSIVVTHHPILIPGENIEYWLSQWNNRALSELLYQNRGPHIYLHGHVHEQSGQAYSSITGGGLFTCAAGAAYQQRTWPLRFSFLDVDLERREIRPTVFGYSTKIGQWLTQSEYSQLVVTALPIHRRTASANPTGAQPASFGSAQREHADAAFELISRTAMSRYLPASTADNEDSRTSIERLFGELMNSGRQDSVDRDFASIVDDVVNGKSRSWSIVGGMGSGKSELLALLYWNVQNRPEVKQGRRLVLFVDLEHFLSDFVRTYAARDAFSAALDHICAAIAASRERPVVFIRGYGEVDARNGNRPGEFIDRLSRMDHVQVITRSNGVSKVPPAANVLCIEAPAFDTTIAGRYFDTFWPITAPSPPDSKHAVLSLTTNICTAHRVPLDIFLIRECIKALKVDPGIKTFSEVLQLSLESVTSVRTATGARTDARKSGERRATDQESVEELSRRVFDEFRTGEHRSANRHESARRLSDGIQPPVIHLLFAHRSIRHWLIARHILTMLEHVGQELLKSQSTARNDERYEKMRRIFQELEFVCPAHINTFVKEILEKIFTERPKPITAALNGVFLDPKLKAGRLLKANTCYLVGRLPQGRMRLEFADKLNDLIPAVDAQLVEIRVATTSLRSAEKSGASFVRQALLKVVTELTKGTPAGDTFKKLRQVERELLLLQRSAYISLAYLGYMAAALKYIEGLHADADQDDTNRGFHLEYYGDVEYQPELPLMSTDRDLTDCPSTFAALIECLNAGRGERSLDAVQAVTLASLARHRHAKDKLTADDIASITDCLETARTRLAETADLHDFLDAAITELKSGRFVIERYVEALYELKFQRRIGWGEMRPQESVAAHSYFVVLLAALFVQEKDLEDVGRLAAFHDLGEAIVGDTARNAITSRSKQDEATAVRRITQIGALTGSSTFRALSRNYQAFDKGDKSDGTQIARDLDRLDLLITLMLYHRHHPDFPRYDEIRQDVEPSQFEHPDIRMWAKRFLEYFDSQKGNTNPSSHAASIQMLFPVGIKQNRQ